MRTTRTPSKKSVRIVKVKSPADDQASPLTKLLVGTTEHKASRKEVAQQIFLNTQTRERQTHMQSIVQNCRDTPLREQLYRRRSDGKQTQQHVTTSPATQLLRAKLGAMQMEDRENANRPFHTSTQKKKKRKAFDEKRAAFSANKIRKTKISALGQRSINTLDFQSL